MLSLHRCSRPARPRPAAPAVAPTAPCRSTTPSDGVRRQGPAQGQTAHQLQPRRREDLAAPSPVVGRPGLCVTLGLRAPSSRSTRRAGTRLGVLPRKRGSARLVADGTPDVCSIARRAADRDRTRPACGCATEYGSVHARRRRADRTAAARPSTRWRATLELAAAARSSAWKGLRHRPRGARQPRRLAARWASSATGSRARATSPS